MTALLWIDSEADEAIDLGLDSFDLYAVMAGIDHAIGQADYPELFGIIEASELQDDVEPSWLEQVRQQARAALAHADELEPEAVALLHTLAPPALSEQVERLMLEAGFTGKDRLGRQWVNGRLQAKVKEPAAGHDTGHEETRKGVIASVLKGAKGVKVAATDVAAKVGLAAWDRMPPKAQKHLINTYTLARAVEHKAMLGFSKGRELAMEAARQRGLSEAHVERVGRVLAVADLAAAWTVNFPVTTAVTGSAVAGKVASWVPVASLAYTAWSTAKNPFATARAASRVVRGLNKEAQAAHEGVRADDAGRLLELFEGHEGDWPEALVCAALDETHDLGRAIDLAKQAIEVGAEPPADNEGLEEQVLAEHGFTGTDRLGRRWSDGKLVPAQHDAGGGKPSGSSQEPAGRVKAALDPTLHPIGQQVVLGLAAGLKANTALAPEKRVAYFNTAQAVIKRMPPGALKRLQEGVKGARFHASTALVKEDLKAAYADHPGTVKALSAVNEIGGAYAAKGAGEIVTGTLLLDGDMQTTGGKELKSAAGVYAHEMSHAIDGPHHEISSSAAWQEAWQAELTSERLSRYAAVKPSEGWAEFGRLLFSGEFDPAKVKAAFPMCYSVWQSNGLLEGLEAIPGGLVLLEEEQAAEPGDVRLEDIFTVRVELPDGSHADARG